MSHDVRYMFTDHRSRYPAIEISRAGLKFLHGTAMRPRLPHRTGPHSTTALPPCPDRCMESMRINMEGWDITRFYPIFMY